MAPSPEKRPRILVIDDDQSTCVLLSQELEAQGYEVVTALNAEDAIKRAYTAAVDLAIVDIFLPGKSGLETIKVLRQEDPHLKVFVLTGADSLQGMEVTTVTERFGVLRTFKKPVEIAKLVAALRKAFQPDPSASS